VEAAGRLWRSRAGKVADCGDGVGRQAGGRAGPCLGGEGRSLLPSMMTMAVRASRDSLIRVFGTRELHPSQPRPTRSSRESHQAPGHKSRSRPFPGRAGTARRGTHY
jgi:hypothetical protein